MVLEKILIAILLFLIRFYKAGISPFFPSTCRFTPTCSTYYIEALQLHGFFKGNYLGIKRILSCHPWAKSGLDEVPKKF
ncbi:MAG: membrane protein insertion efficiency factor YidD [Flavobacterium sp.]|nr:membrane protein insertion efficiency factor YidD [Flavobacterium sp.]